MVRLLLSLCLLLPFAAVAQPTFPGYMSTKDLSGTSPGSFRFGLLGYDNPALLAVLHQPDAAFVWVDQATGRPDATRWGLFTAVPHLGYGMVRTARGDTSVTDHRLSFGFGDRTFSAGVGYGWSSGDRALLNRSNSWTLGLLLRPDRHVSLGLVGSAATTGDTREAAADLALRPLGTELLTVFADYAIAEGVSLKRGSWSAGAVVEALPGVRVTGRYFDTHAFSVGFDLSLGRVGGSARATFDDRAERAFTTYAVRLGAYDRTVLQKLMPRSRYLSVNLKGPVKYQTYRWFDSANRLADILEQIDAARADESVAGIAVNTSGMEAGRSMLWEIREKLKEFRASGKKVVIFVDRMGVQEYHLASVADRIVMDPTGLLMLEGYLMGRTFLKGTLEKLGIGYDEWRFFTYKSANESLSRDSMSAADREQRQRLVDEFYAISREEVAAAGRATPESFDRMVNEDVLFSAEEALALGLVDTLGRWEEVTAAITSLEGAERGMIGRSSLGRFIAPTDDRWGEPPRIALIYALGVCAMDEGINARSLARDVEAAAKDPGVKAIVLRVDSPGGDAMASDYVAEALRKAGEKKPVIVSQGQVAASGGYWLSMYADTIVANPGTITGSIGVIGGWMYNKELKEKLGMTTDHVKAGRHADLGFGFTLPLLGVGLPDRNLTDDERNKVERMIRKAYRDFVGKVARGREKDTTEIDRIGQGRVWSGRDGLRLGLVDVLGGLDAALRIARERSGVPEGEEVTVVEAPRPGLFNLAQLMPSPLPLGARGGARLEHLLFLLRHNGMPMPVLPMEEMED